MRELTQDRPSVRYVYSVHRDTDHPHAHVVLTGTKEDLYMDVEDIDRVRAKATENFREAERRAECEVGTDRQSRMLAEAMGRSSAGEAEAEPEPER